MGRYWVGVKKWSMYLGIGVDRWLKWNKHIILVCKKCSSVLGHLTRVTRSLPTVLKKQLYQSLVLPYLDYCAVVCMGWLYSQVDAKRVDGIQKWGMRWTLSERWDCLSVDIRSRLGRCTSTNRRRILMMIYLRRCLHGRCPGYLEGILFVYQTAGTVQYTERWKLIPTQSKI